jgi:RNA recognition motif-containing protein
LEKRKNNRKHDYRKSDGDNQKCKVFVENLNFTTNWGKLKDFMKQAGIVERADIIKNMDGKSRGKG